MVFTAQRSRRTSGAGFDAEFHIRLLGVGISVVMESAICLRASGNACRDGAADEDDQWSAIAWASSTARRLSSRRRCASPSRGREEPAAAEADNLQAGIARTLRTL